jgi:hypothetical protein
MSGWKKKSGLTAPHKIIVQQLASEPDTKQTFRPVQPMKFVNFEYEELVKFEEAISFSSQIKYN